MSDKPSFNDYAFPTKESNSWGDHHHHGMTLRDYFAAKAIQGLLAHPDCGWVGDTDENSKERTMIVAKEAFAVADAMLKARERK